MTDKNARLYDERVARFCYDRQALSRLNDEHSLKVASVSELGKVEGKPILANGRMNESKMGCPSSRTHKKRIRCESRSIWINVDSKRSKSEYP